MNKPILVVDDEADIRTILSDILSDEGYEVVTAAHSEEAYHKIDQHNPGMAILDIWLENSDQDGLEILQTLNRQYPDMTVLMISGHGNVETAVKAMHLGAYDFIEKPFKIDQLIRIVERAEKTNRIQTENQALKSRLNLRSVSLSGESAAIQAIIKQVEGLKGKSTRVMIKGPRGTGKSSVAAILANTLPYEVLDASTLKAEDLTACLSSDRKCLIFDHIQNMSKSCQTLLMEALKSGQAMPRLISILDNNDRSDFSGYLMGQLSVESIIMPGLSERAQDIPVLAKEFIRDACHHFSIPQKTLTDGFQRSLSVQTWPGHIGQLKLACQWALEMALIEEAVQVEAHHLPGNKAPEGAANTNDGHLMDQPLKQARESFEKQYLDYHMRQSDGVITKMADKIGMDRAALHRKMKSLEIGEGADQPAPSSVKEA